MLCLQSNARLVEDALHRIYSGALTGRNEKFGDPGLWKYIGMGPRSTKEPHPHNMVFLTVADLKVALSNPLSQLILLDF